MIIHLGMIGSFGMTEFLDVSYSGLAVTSLRVISSERDIKTPLAFTKGWNGVKKPHRL